MSGQLWVNPDRTVLVRLNPDGSMEVAMRESSDHIWGPPTKVEQEP